MVQLADLQKQTDLLSQEDRESLLAYLLHSLPSISGPGDEEVFARETEMDGGNVVLHSHADFLKAAGYRG